MDNAPARPSSRRRLGLRAAVTAVAGVAALGLAALAGSPASAASSGSVPSGPISAANSARAAGAAPLAAQPAVAGLPGIDVSHYQGSINWGSVKGAGIQFAYIKATEGTTYVDPNFGSYYTGAYNARVIRGAYHFARPSSSSGASQANYFLAHGGRWSADNLTLPGALDIEYNPSGSTCYGLSAASMVNWIRDFVNTYHAATTRWPVIYSTTNWWTTCTGNSSAFSSNDPLWIARYSSTVGSLPAGWGTYTIWQYSSTGSVPGISGAVDRDTFNGSSARLLALANNTP